MPSTNDLDHDATLQPRLGTPNLEELEEQRPPPHFATPKKEIDEETKLGQALTALIWDGDHHRIPFGTRRAITAGPDSRVAWDHQEAKHSLTSARQNPGRILGQRHLLDMVGMTLAFLAIWISYRVFTALPSIPSQSPWALLGSARIEAAPVLGVTESSPSGKRLPPIGQFDFAQVVPPASLPSLHSREPVELYRSIYELEEVFEARYIPPPGCSGPEADTNIELTACVNHRLTARRAFLASNGRSMVPEADLRVPENNSLWETDQGGPRH